MKIINKLLKAVGKFPCFLWPVSSENGKYCLPVYNADDKEKAVTGYRPLAAIEGHNSFNISIELSDTEQLFIAEGQPALFAYAISMNDYKVGDYEQIREYLYEFIDKQADIYKKLDYGKRMEILNFIDDRDMLGKFLVETLENECSIQVRYNASVEIRNLENKYKNDEVKCTENNIEKPELELQFSDEIIQLFNNRRVSSEYRIKRRIQDMKDNIYFTTEGIHDMAQFIVERNRCENMKKLMQFDDFIVGRPNLQPGTATVILQKGDSMDVVMQSDALDKLAKEIEAGTHYNYCFSTTMDASCIALIYRIKVGVLARNRHANTKELMQFWDISSWDMANTYEKCLQNVIIWEAGNGESSKDVKGYVMLGETVTNEDVYGKLSGDRANQLQAFARELRGHRTAKNLDDDAA